MKKNKKTKLETKLSAAAEFSEYWDYAFECIREVGEISFNNHFKNTRIIRNEYYNKEIGVYVYPSYKVFRESLVDLIKVNFLFKGKKYLNNFGFLDPKIKLIICGYVVLSEIKQESNFDMFKKMILDIDLFVSEIISIQNAEDLRATLMDVFFYSYQAKES